MSGSHSGSPIVRDVREAHRLIEDCRDLGSDPARGIHTCSRDGALIGAAAAKRDRSPVDVISGFGACLDARYVHRLNARPDARRRSYL